MYSSGHQGPQREADWWVQPQSYDEVSPSHDNVMRKCHKKIEYIFQLSNKGVLVIMDEYPHF